MLRCLWQTLLDCDSQKQNQSVRNPRVSGESFYLIEIERTCRYPTRKASEHIAPAVALGLFGLSVGVSSNVCFTEENMD